MVDLGGGGGFSCARYPCTVNACTQRLSTGKMLLPEPIDNPRLPDRDHHRNSRIHATPTPGRRGFSRT